jgi:hypothetical protein
MGVALLLVPCAALACTERTQQEQGEQTFVCWRYEPNVERGWRIRSIAVEAHTAVEAIASCNEIILDEVRRQNRKIVRT